MLHLLPFEAMACLPLPLPISQLANFRPRDLRGGLVDFDREKVMQQVFSTRNDRGTQAVRPRLRPCKGTKNVLVAPR